MASWWWRPSSRVEWAPRAPEVMCHFAAGAGHPGSSEEGDMSMKIPRMLLALASLLVVFAAAYVAAPQVASGQDIQRLAGRWIGWMSPTRGSSVPIEVDVKPDGSYTSKWGSREGRGVVRMEGGKLMAEGQLATGTGQPAQGTGKSELNLTVKDGKQTITGIGRDDEGPFNFQLTKVMAAAAPPAAAPSGYSLVTDQRLIKPEPENWLLIRGNYQGWNYSPLDKINTSNVKKLIPVWSMATGVTSGHQAPPIVNNGMMFISTPYNQV